MARRIFSGVGARSMEVRSDASVLQLTVKRWRSNNMVIINNIKYTFDVCVLALTELRENSAKNSIFSVH